jgi:MFS family permease
LPKEVQRSLNVSWKEGIPAAVMISIVDYYLVPLGLFLGATTQQIGFLVALPHLLGSVSQLFAVKAVRLAGSRLRFLVWSAALQAASLFPVAFLVLTASQWRIEILILLMVGFRVVGNFIGAAWGSLMSDYLPVEMRGHYLGWRSQVVGVAGLLSLGLAGVVLFLMKKVWPGLGFFVIFLAASLARAVSTFLMARMINLPLQATPESEFTFLMFLRRFKESNFVKYVLYVSSITFATHVASPYFSVYMLRDLEMSYLGYMAVHFASVITGLIAFPIWGKHADLVGNARILKVTSLLVPTIPLLWTFSKNLGYIVGVELFAGFVWGGFNLCATNFIYDAVSPEKRVRCLGYFNLINGVAIFTGASLGGFLAERLPPVFGFSMLTLFLLSGLLRLLAHFFLSRRFREVREEAQKVSSSQLFFSVIGVRPLEGLNRNWSIFPSE